ncbi:melanoma-associated antigen 10-like [Cervus elaphus]|uniref:melanoma-associated antigen 10-like n=1 Tax=Cervus elaphus TaxID=9860 RepID=UPI001CC2C2CD|nr:melanoma-associated antigen 10-like [Cervus elaphus]
MIEVPGIAGTPSPFRGSQRVWTLPTAQATTPSIISDQGSGSGKRKRPCTPRALPDGGHLLRDAIDDKVGDLVSFLLLRYHRKEVATKADMLSVLRDYQDLFPVILSQAAECMELVFGIDVKALDSTGLFYVLVNTLGLTYNDLLGGDEESMPMAGLLVNTLSIIFVDGNCAPEEKVWEMLRIMGLYAGMNHFIYGDPRELLTQVWVQAGYLEHRQVPNSDPARYEFLWGPRTYAETTKMKVLEFLAKVHGTTPSAFPDLYEDALQSEKTGPQTRVVARARTRARATARARAGTCARTRAYSRATSNSSSCPN